MLEIMEAQRLQPALAIGLHVIGEDRIHQHRHMAEEVVEDVRLLQIVELVLAADEAGRGKATVGEMREEHRIGDEARHGDDMPARRALQPLVEAAEIGNRVGFDAERVQTIEKRLAGAARQNRFLAMEQRAPDRVLLGSVGFPVLRYGCLLNVLHRGNPASVP